MLFRRLDVAGVQRAARRSVKFYGNGAICRGSEKAARSAR